MSAIDLHTHTWESDGTLSPQDLVQAAVAGGLQTLAITDHDGITHIQSEQIEIIPGIELTCKDQGGSVHLLCYFFNTPPTREFVAWLDELLAARSDRNRRLALRLQELGLEVQLEEASQYGRRITGRPHFARVLVEKGYAATLRDAFDLYVGERGQAYVEREAPTVEEAIAQMLAAGGLPSLAHPIRLRGDQEAAIARFVDAGLEALEAFHSDHDHAATERYLGLATKYGLAVSGGSDFHGTAKPGVELGRGIGGNLDIPEWVLPALRARAS